ncbi:Multi-component phenol hydoxylase, beta subunit; LapL [Azotobacter vinelandii CA]|uniref:Multi-component phenol hydoxylase, beta subunit LapL n=2 Tax=Azotobacter vinelandii TaxID=354 RepID=C1DN73_AZOVD|nr:aromatic/alkene monooxygenase hydroxylase subunit beta [Azotobacter vinelandii]ACO79240.1 Multi-component phenol hydoxylase, beta subunit; LapL [Azotobacter vinelandii DJ]AGK13660.1 Multi-component phenol hydoxylase, beta subunit; LapL [Azotobacter vinelandii CA]AGK18185.1 Multi-component phenol hydoxylase, beta subunit; LapL [Azotobacter vinelandii CA6]WKN20207.1 aromatic/alkene monooxygenase hydroxylase subunit beta [Azotobacter vinelandii]SFX96271.1 phenol 2-monooxygenase P1 subunit [Azo
MQIDLRTVSIQPLRNTFDHLVRRFGDKPASRYQEGSYDIQAAENLHYRPTWDPEQELYDTGITRIVMQDWYALKDPRQFYYSTYTLTRARQQDSAEASFAFVESRGLAEALSDELRRTALDLLVPLRHAAWGANQNNTFICGYGYGTAFTQPCIYQAMDNLGIAQYLSRLGLLLGGTEALEAGKAAWTSGDAWQPLRRYVEDCLVLRDPFELFVAQNVALDGLLYPLVYEALVDDHLAGRGGSAVAMLTQFMSDWFAETGKWVDAVLKVAAAESEHNRAQLQTWIGAWSERAAAALLPVVGQVPGAEADELVGERVAAFKARLEKTGIAL